MFHCPVGVWIIEQHAMILCGTVPFPTVIVVLSKWSVCGIRFRIYTRWWHIIFVVIYLVMELYGMILDFQVDVSPYLGVNQWNGWYFTISKGCIVDILYNMFQ